MGLIRKHTGYALYKKFDGKPYQIYGRDFLKDGFVEFDLHDYSTKIQADGAAKRLRPKGWLARVVKSPFHGTKPWIIYIRKK